MAFTVIPNGDIDPGSPGSTDLFTKLRDNDDFLFAQRAGLILVEKKLITADVQDVTFAGLNGETDEIYRLVGRLVTTSSPDFELRPNAITAGQSSVSSRDFGAAFTGTRLKLTANGGSSGLSRAFDATFWARKDVNGVGVVRYLLSDGMSVSQHLQSGSLWTDTTTTVTSLVVHGTTAASIKDGSTIALYKLRQS